ncbi:MAG: phosphoglycerate kinase [Dehalococcoidia bacterium]|nr:phosphoglycerate kinase [Dehalococcoidia bacterium]
MNKMTIRDIDGQGKRVLVRVDFNVPFDKETGRILDDSRLRAALPTIQYLREHGARVVLCSHLGRPKGKVVEELRMSRVGVGDRLSELLGAPVHTLYHVIGPKAVEATQALKPGEVILLENVRFFPEEEANDPKMSHALAELADIYVDDAFGTAHRAHASTVGIASYLPAVAGFLMEKEIDYLDKALTNPARPFAAIIGGAKISTKIGVLRNLLSRIDCLIVGGGMASTLLKANGVDVGESLVEDDQLDTARDLMEQADEKGIPLFLPEDVVVADRIAEDALSEVASVDDIPQDMRIVDVGPDTVASFREAVEDCMTVIWNGPLGVAEYPAFAKGSLGMAEALASLNATTIVGGGETVALIHDAGLEDKFTHVSTGGGASLEYLEGKTLPGVAALMDKK